MKAIEIRVVEKRATLKHKVEHTADDEMIVHRLPKDQWKNHNMARGKIALDGYQAVFFMSVEIWSLDDYKRQWREGLARLRDHNESCLVENFYKIRGNITWIWWLLYKIDGIVYIQKSYCPHAPYDRMSDTQLFTPDNCYDYIPSRMTHEDDGEKIPEIAIPMSDIFKM